MLLVVLDTNIALDVLLFQEPQAEPLRAALQAGHVRWLATARMREELQRVLAYPHIAARMQFYQRTAPQRSLVDSGFTPRPAPQRQTPYPPHRAVESYGSPPPLAAPSACAV